jgi:hypothetical protein
MPLCAEASAQVLSRAALHPGMRDVPERHAATLAARGRQI